MAFQFKRAIQSALESSPKESPKALFTPWADQIIENGTYESGKVLQEYPRPLLQRDSYLNLNGWWEYAIRKNPALSPEGDPNYKVELTSQPDSFDGPILVPFSPEAPLSGVNRLLKSDEILWYKRKFDFKPTKGMRCLLNFEAVDFACSCWVNGKNVGYHEGGYIPFSLDITDALNDIEGKAHEIVVAVADPTNDDVQPRGKQRLNRGTIWYSPQSGIWQTAWIEEVPESYVEDIQINTHINDKELVLKLFTKDLSSFNSFTNIEVEVNAGSFTKSYSDTCQSSESEIEIKIPFKSKEMHLWSPDDPFLYDLKIKYGDDEFKSYFGFRSCMIETDKKKRRRFFLNRKQFFLKGVLDQGYWPDGLMTAPSDEALIFDIEFAKSLGFNMLRKHVKIESRRWYYHCDVIGMLVWQDMVNGGDEYNDFLTRKLPTLFPQQAANIDDTKMFQRFGSQTTRYQKLWIREATGAVKLLRNHPCICTWSIFNEGWGQFNSVGMTNNIRREDRTRPFDEASGWFDQGRGNYVSEHNYFRDLAVPENMCKEQKGDRARMISEFGGIAYFVPNHSLFSKPYGYDICTNIADYRKKVSGLLDEAQALEKDGLSGYIYTQLSDVEEEANGLITYDRRFVKLEQPD